MSLAPLRFHMRMYIVRASLCVAHWILIVASAFRSNKEEKRWA